MVDLKKIWTVIKNYKDLILGLFAVIIFSIFIGYLLHFIFDFDESTLQWLASAVFQGFGALLAIVVSVSLYLIKVITDGVREAMQNVREYLQRTEEVNPGNIEAVHNMLDQIINEPQRIAERTATNVENLKKRIYPVLISIIFLIISALVILMFIKSEFSIKYPFTLIFNDIIIEKELLISISISYLVILSMYCLFLLAIEIKHLLTYEAREN